MIGVILFCGAVEADDVPKVALSGAAKLTEIRKRLER
jgi:hypothetical protein